MRKKIALALSMIMMVLLLGACGKDPTTVDYNGKSYEDLKSEMDITVQRTEYLIELLAQNGIDSVSSLSDYEKESLIQQGVSETQIEASQKWEEMQEEFGKVKKIDEDTFKVTKSGKTLTTDMTIAFAKKDVNFEVVYDYYSMDITGISVDPIYSLGEKMQKAGLNTVISMSVVFAVLILISLLISCFNIFPYLEMKKAEKKTAAVPQTESEAVTEVPEAPVTPAPAVQTDDTELIAVIAAAIAADTGTSTSDFVVRSINRR